MSALRSDCRRQIAEVTTAPHMLILIMSLGFGSKGNFINCVARISPNPPSFRRIAARIMEPATGASTWALGSHKWVRNSGSFTKNAVVDAIHHVVNIFWES